MTILRYVYTLYVTYVSKIDVIYVKQSQSIRKNPRLI